MSRGSPWSPQDRNILRVYLEKGAGSVTEVAARLNRSPEAVKKMAGMMGVSIAGKSPGMTGPSAPAIPPTDRAEAVEFANKDRQHVAACLAGGGFIRREIVCGQLYNVLPGGVRRWVA